MARNKELTQGSRLEAESYRTRSEGGVSKVTRIGNHVGIGNWSGIDWEWCQSLNCEGEGYAEVEGRRKEQDSDWKPQRMEAGQHTVKQSGGAASFDGSRDTQT